MSKKMKTLIVAVSSVVILTLAISGIAVSGIARADDSQGTPGAEHPHRGPGPSFDTLSEILGLSADEITAQLKEGKTITEIAAEQGLSEEELQQALYAAMAEKLAQKVADGSITQEQADKMLERMQEGKLFLGPPHGKGMKGHAPRDSQGDTSQLTSTQQTY